MQLVDQITSKKVELIDIKNEKMVVEWHKQVQAGGKNWKHQTTWSMPWERNIKNSWIREAQKQIAICKWDPKNLNNMIKFRQKIDNNIKQPH